LTLFFFRGILRAFFPRNQSENFSSVLWIPPEPFFSNQRPFSFACARSLFLRPGQDNARVPRSSPPDAFSPLPSLWTSGPFLSRRPRCGFLFSWRGWGSPFLRAGPNLLFFFPCPFTRAVPRSWAPSSFRHKVFGAAAREGFNHRRDGWFFSRSWRGSSSARSSLSLPF